MQAEREPRSISSRRRWWLRPAAISMGSGGGGNAAGDERPGSTDNDDQGSRRVPRHQRPRRHVRRRLRRPPGLLRQANAKRFYGRQLKLVAKRDDNGQASRTSYQVRGARRAGQGVRGPPRVDDHVRRGEVPRRQQDPDLRLEDQPRVEPEDQTCTARRARTSASTAQRLVVVLRQAERLHQHRDPRPTRPSNRNDSAKGWEGLGRSGTAAPNAGTNRVRRHEPELRVHPGDIAADLDQMKNNELLEERDIIDGAGSAKLGQAFQDNNMTRRGRTCQRLRQQAHL